VETAVAVFRRLLLGIGAVLVLTGVPLIWWYEPQGAPRSPFAADVAEWPYLLQDVHRWASYFFVQAALVLLVLTVVAAFADRRVRPRWPAAVGVTLFALAASFTGYLLPWDQLGLRAVTVGTRIRGVTAAWHSDAGFMLMDGVEVPLATYRFWVIVHTVALPLLLAAGWWAYRRYGPHARSGTRISGEPPEVLVPEPA
jgi:cytochrome b6